MAGVQCDSRPIIRFWFTHICYQQWDETNVDGHVQTAGLPVAAKMPASSLRTINQVLNERNPMRALASLLAILVIASLAACSNLPMSSSSQSGQVQHPDVFNSYID